MAKLIETKSYIKKVSKFLKKHKEITEQYKKTLRLLKDNHMHPSLRLHKITGTGFCSVSINMSYRIAIVLLVEDDGTITLVDIGSHDQIY